MRAQGLQSDGSWILDGMSIRDQVLELDRDSGSDDKISEAWTDAAREKSAETRRMNAKGEQPSSPGGAADSSPSNSGGKAVTKTPEFKAWFGKSKAVDEKGEPLVVYHGTAMDFDTFDPQATKAALGPKAIYASSSSEIASDYAMQTDRNSMKMKSALEPVTKQLLTLPMDSEEWKNAAANEKQIKKDFRDGAGGGNVKPLYFKIENPYVFDADGKSWHVSVDKNMQPQKRGNSLLSQAVENAKANGHDGVIIRGVVDWSGRGKEIKADTYIAFDSTQIKSATGNRGTFDPKSPKINEGLHA